MFDDVVTIELRAIAGVTYPLVDKPTRRTQRPALVTDGLTPANVNDPFLTKFPYLGNAGRAGIKTAPAA